MSYLLALGDASASSGTIQSAFDTAINAVKTDALAMIGSAVPVALSIGAAVLAIRLGWKFFKSMAK